MSTGTLPQWDVSQIWPSIESDEFRAAFADLKTQMDALEATANELNVDADHTPDAESLERMLKEYESASRAYRTLGAYVSSFVSTDATNEEAQAAYSNLQPLGVTLSKLGSRFTAWVGGSEVDVLAAQNAVVAEHQFALTRSLTSAKHQMAPDLEDLSADLSVDGPSAWSRFFGNFSSTISVDVPMPDGTTKTGPMSMVRGMATNPDRDVRRAAYEAELETWKRHELPIASALNALKGWTLTTSARRGWDTPLDSVLFGNNTSRKALEAMQTAVTESIPDWHRYLNAKAKALGLERLDFYDIFAPVPGAKTGWGWEDAMEFVTTNFEKWSPELAAMAKRADDENWMDAEPRPGKRDGGFCMWIREDQSLILLNWSGSTSSVKTLAHELGHAWHNTRLANRTLLNRSTPMALAETASIFCETIITNALLEQASGDEKLAILELELHAACQVVVDIHSRFIFESNLFEKRRERELSARELCELMTAAQDETYGDALASRHPYMWASKPHYYGSNFYNWPYTYGLLFGLGLYALSREEGPSFAERYDDLLSRTGMATGSQLAAEFGFDVEDPDFWRGSLKVLSERIQEFEQLVG